MDLCRPHPSLFLYMRQLGSSYDSDATRDVLEKNSTIVQALTELFRVNSTPVSLDSPHTEVCDKRRELIKEPANKSKTHRRGV